MLKMIFPRLIVDEDVVKEHKDKGLKIRFQCVIHEALEGGRCIAKAKRHDQELIMAFMGMESCLRNVCFFHADLMVT